MDAWLKRNFWVVAVALALFATYFLAAGSTQLIASKYLAIDTSAIAKSGPQPIPMPATLSALQTRSVSARSLLDSNPFDSVTGPIKEAPAVATDPGETVDDDGEMHFSPCSGGTKLTITMVDPRVPANSFAVMSTGEGPGTKPMVREGSNMSGRDVFAIVREKVYFHEGSSYCFIGMFQPASAAPPPSPMPTPTIVDPGEKPPSGVPRVPPDIEKGIKKVDEHNFEIDRIVVDKIIENQAELMKTARIVPEQENGKVIGIRLLNIRPDTLLGKLGMQAGDMLRTINGFDMTSPEKALEAYAKLRTAPQIQIGIVRGGKPADIEYHIK